MSSLRRIASRLSGIDVYAIVEIIIDTNGDGEFNRSLAKERAKAIRNALLADGLVLPSQIISFSSGVRKNQKDLPQTGAVLDGIGILIAKPKAARRSIDWYVNEIKGRGLVIRSKFSKKSPEARREKVENSRQPAEVAKPYLPVAKQALFLGLILPGTIKSQEEVPVKSLLGAQANAYLSFGQNSAVGIGLANVAYTGRYEGIDISLVRYSARLEYLYQIISSRYVGFGTLVWAGADYLGFTFKKTLESEASTVVSPELTARETEQLPSAGGGLFFFARPPEGRFALRLSLELRGNADLIDVFLGIGVAAIKMSGGN